MDQPTPLATPTMSLAPIEKMVPYSTTSIWNTPIDPSPKYDVHSAEMVSNLVLSHDGQIITAGEAYNYPVYFADEQTPRWDIPCTINKCTIAHSDQDVIRADLVQGVPIPEDAQPGEDTDARMIIIDKVTRLEYDLSKAQRTATGWTTGTVSVYNILWDGTPVMHSSRGSGIPAYAGLLRPWEIQQGRIEHALAFGYTEPAADQCVFPASKTDGESNMHFAIPEGARLQLDPSLTDQDFDQMGLDPTAKIIARALQEYGMILVDDSGSFKIYVEDLINNPYATQDWTDPDLNLTKESIYNIPYTAFRVLELPPGYWDSTVNTAYHGKCLTFSNFP
ncbi:MAG TPA: hypothetical protein VK909_21645 [Anaerolineales bacterium]|nr:hypothetical protein [Anaerolineales bacterium]